MEIFYLTLRQMLMMFSLIAVGFILRKKGILSENSDKTMAKMETFISTLLPLVTTGLWVIL